MSDPVMSSVPTSQRPINGALAGLGALVGYYVVTKFHIEDKDVALIAAPVVGMMVSGVQATIGDWARGELESSPKTGIAKLIYMLLARIG
ncbi:MAG: hypothetical protein ACRDKE_07720 [Solirubrobacterales bacterium]